MKTCYIVGAGEFHGDISPDSSDLVIAADGGYDSLTSRGIRCDLLIGDMDSLCADAYGVEIIRHSVEKDETDMHLAYLEGVRRGYTSFLLYGGVGGRDDHTFANYCLLSYIRSEGNRASLIGNGTRAFVLKNEATRVKGNEGKTVSVFAFGGAARGVCIKGLYYEVENIDLSPEFPLGVSNHLTDSEGEISVREGTLLVIMEI